jgi:DNA helicase HerA-like ATPase
MTRDDHVYKGRIFGKSVLEATFRSFYGTDLFLGELLAAEDPERVRRFLFRVIQVTYGSDSSDPGWAERTAGAFMSGDTAGSPYSLHDPEQRLYKIATCQPLGYIDAGGGFRKPKSLPAQFAKVTAPTADDFTFLRERMGDLGVGVLRSGEDVIDLEVGIRGDTLTSHVGVFATTGMGKSNLMKVLAGEILASRGRYATLLFDRRPPEGLRDARDRRRRHRAAAVPGRAHAGRPADRLPVEPRAGGRDLPRDPAVRRRLDRAGRRVGRRRRPRRGARRGHQHDAGGAASRPAHPRHAVRLP